VVALEEAGLTPDPSLEASGDFTETTGHRAALELIARADRPTAIFAANDAMAIGAISALRDCGVRVPDDIAVAGFDDIPLARYMNPSLSTVHVPIAEMGELAVATLIHAVKHKDDAPRGRQRIPTTLVVRQSCGGGVPGQRFS
jgi:DNA-binding LacI/PurR family transcriptional regulator